MPNWCENELTVSGKSNKAVRKFLEYAKGRYPAYSDDRGESEPEESELCWNKFIPVPKDVLKKGYQDAGSDWQISNWGTKWVACDLNVSVQNKLIAYSFNTAWGPMSENLVAVMAEKFPDLTFMLEYAEPGCDFSGVIEASGGVVTRHDQGIYGEFYGWVDDEEGALLS